MFNVENLIINRILRGTLFDKATGEVIFSIDQISDPSLECSGEQVFVNDAMGQKIAAFDRTKDAKFTGSNAVVNFGLMAAQLGSDQEVANADNKIILPAFELIEVKDAAKVSLVNDPAGDLKYIYSTHSDKSKNKAYPAAVEASAEAFSITGKEITLPTGAFQVGDYVAVWYDRESAEAVKVTNTAENFAKGGKFVLEVLAADICDVNTEYYAYIIFNNAKMDNAVTLTLTNEAKHGFTVNAMQDYCSPTKELFTIAMAK